MKRLALVLVVLVGLLVAVDYGAAALAESAVARQMRDQLGLDRRARRRCASRRPTPRTLRRARQRAPYVAQVALFAPACGHVPAD